MRVLFLGTGNAFASGGRNPMAILARSRGIGVLFDCGPATLVALKRHGLSPEDVDVILLSHHHGDHFAGIPFLVLHETHVGPREKPLTVFGPPGTEGVLTEAGRLCFPGLDPSAFLLDYRDVAPGQELALGAVAARPFEVDHFSNGVAFGWRLELDGKTVVFSGDTAWTRALARESAGADLFVCECSSFARRLDRHMSDRDLRAHRREIGARRTLLVHPGDDVLAHEGELTFELARDGMEVEL